MVTGRQQMVNICLGTELINELKQGKYKETWGHTSSENLKMVLDDSQHL